MPPTTVGPYTLRQSLTSILTSGLLRYYRLGEASGTTATDSSSAGQNGTYSATGVTYGVPSAVGDANTAVSFDGSTGFMSAPSSGLPTGATPISFGCWVNLTELPGVQTYPMLLGNGAGGQTLAFFIDSSGKINLSTNAAGTPLMGPLAVGQWYFLCGTYDGTQGRLYVNGTLLAGPTPLTLNLTYGSLYVGQNSVGGDRLHGSIDEVFVCSGALDPVTIQAMYAWGTPSQRTALLESGNPFQVRVSTETIALYVQNKSQLTLYLAFQEARPSAPDSTASLYNAVVLPGHQALVPVQSRGSSSSERSLNAMGAFTGSVWIMPRDYTGNLAFTGNVSKDVGVFVTAFGPYDPLPATAVDTPAVDLSSQPRVVTIPAPGGGCHADTVALTGQGTYILTHPLLSTSITPRSSWAQTLAFYLHACSATLKIPDQAYVDLTLRMVQQDNTNAVISSFDLLHFALSGVQISATIPGAVNYTYLPSSPFAFSFVPLANTVQISLAWFIGEYHVATNNVSLFDSWQADIDWQSNGMVPPIGQGAGVISGGRF